MTISGMEKGHSPGLGLISEKTCPECLASPIPLREGSYVPHPIPYLPLHTDADASHPIHVLIYIQAHTPLLMCLNTHTRARMHTLTHTLLPPVGTTHYTW